MLDNEFPVKTMFYCMRIRWLNLEARASPELQPEQAMRNPKPFTVFQPVPGQNGKPLFIVHAYSIEQARALVAAKVAGETIVVAAASSPRRREPDDPRHQERPSRDGLRLSHAEVRSDAAWSARRWSSPSS